MFAAGDPDAPTRLFAEMFVLSSLRTPASSPSCGRGDGTILLTRIPRRSRSIGGLLGLALLLWGALVIGPSVARAAERMATPARSLEMTALFAEPSYSPGQVARLRVVADATRLTVQPIAAFSRSANPYAPIANDPAVGPARTVAWQPGAGTVTVRIGRWASGVYFVRVRSARGQVVAPVVVRPAHLGQAPVAVVVPTFTWQAYNRRGGDTWYVCSCVHTVDLTRPYLDGGVPYNFGQYDRNFFRWLARNHVRVDVLADEDLNRIATGVELRHLYRMVVFESHGEYVTSHMFDITEQYRNLGGHLAFLSANDFFREVVISGDSMTLIGRFRDLGRPEAALIGAQYIDWYRNRYPNQPYRVVGAGRVPWLFAAHRPEGRQPDPRLLRDRDRRDHARLAARHDGRGHDPEHLPGQDRGHDLLHDRRRRGSI